MQNTNNKIIPSTTDWYYFIEKLLLWFSSLALSFSVLFFVAYNWDKFANMGKFALVEILLSISILLYLYFDINKLLSKIAITSSCILIGVLLALVGQTYQTGADTWELFFYWSILILPFVIIARFSPLWLILIVLVNTSIILYTETFGGIFSIYFNHMDTVLLSIFLFNTLAWIIWQYFESKLEYLKNNYSINILAFVSLFIVTLLLLNVIWEGGSFLYIILYLITIAGVYFVYKIKNINLFILSLLSLSLSVIIINIIIKAISWNNLLVFGFLIIALVVVFVGGIFSKWLKNIQKEQNNESK